jgi:hypothetical protein
MPSILFALAGFAVCEIVTHPGRKLRKALKSLRIGRLEIFPCIRFHGRSKTLHFHHWIYMPLLLAVSIPTNIAWLESTLVRSFLFGGAVQGFLINKKARQVIYQNPLEQSDEYR